MIIKDARISYAHFLFLHPESVIQNRNFKPRFPLKWKPFSAINAPLQTLMKRRTQTVSSKIIFPVNELSFLVEKLQKVGTGRQHMSSQTFLFHSGVASSILTFQSVSALLKTTFWKGLGEKKRLHPHTRCLSDEVLTCSHTYTRPLPPPTNTRSTSKQSAGKKVKRKRGNARTEQSPTSPLLHRAAAESHTIQACVEPLEGGSHSACRGWAGPACVQKLPQSDFPAAELQPSPCPCLKNFLNSIPVLFLTALKPYSVLQYGFVRPTPSYWAVSSSQWETHVSSTDALPCPSAHVSAGLT